MRRHLGWTATLVMTVIVTLPARSPAGGNGTRHTAEVVRSTTSQSVSEHTVRRAGHDRRSPASDLYGSVSDDNLIGMLADLTGIKPYSGWRLSTTDGEAEAIRSVQQHLAELWFLRSAGLTVDRSPFRTYKGVELHETRVEISLDGNTFEVPADGSPGHRDRLDLAIRFDSDGVLNDSALDPVVAEGAPVAVRTLSQLEALTSPGLAGHVVLLDYALVDRSLLENEEAVTRAWQLLDKLPAGVVQVTSFSNRQGESHGAFAGDVSAFTWVETQPRVPILNVRLEDLEPFGITGWDDLDEIERVRLTWDVDLHEVGHSAYLVARIPGLDASRAMILGAHIDSPNTPGALDNGSGSVALLEVARVLDRARILPPTDLYLVWFGSHERGVYGSANFAAAHSALLDRTIAMLQMDCLGHPLNGISNYLTFEAWPYGRFGDDRLLWPDYLIAASPSTRSPKTAVDYYGIGSDNSNFAGYNVPNALLIFMNPYDDTEVHYANHLHDPYDTLELAELERDTLVDMTRVMVTAAVRTGVDDPDLRPFPEPTRRALFVASHTEGIHMSPAGLTDFGMALGWEGFDVDVVPYGMTVTADELADADLVVVLPVHDYPSPIGGTGLYDEAWSPEEIDLLEAYVADGGLLVLTNTAHRLKYFNVAYEENEDSRDVNALAMRFGVSFRSGTLAGDEAQTVGAHPLTAGVSRLRILDGNGVRFTTDTGLTLAAVGASPAVAIVEYGAGEVIVLADLGILGNREDPPPNLRFWRNLAEYAR
jgi:hypothetical protein